MWRSMYPTSSSTLIHQVLRERDRRWSKFIGRISYSSNQSTLACLYLALWNTREIRSATRGWVSNHRVASRAVRSSAAAYTTIQSTWHGPLWTDRSWEDSAMKGCTFTCSTLYHSCTFAISISTDAAMWEMKRKVIAPLSGRRSCVW